MKASDFDRKFDDGKDVTADLDLSQVRRPRQEQRRVNVDFPAWMIESSTVRRDDSGHPPVHYQGLDRGEARAHGLLIPKRQRSGGDTFPRRHSGMLDEPRERERGQFFTLQRGLQGKELTPNPLYQEPGAASAPPTLRTA